MRPPSLAKAATVPPSLRGAGEDRDRDVAGSCGPRQCGWKQPWCEISHGGCSGTTPRPAAAAAPRQWLHAASEAALPPPFGAWASPQFGKIWLSVADGRIAADAFAGSGCQ